MQEQHVQPFTSSNNTADGPYVVLRRYERGQIQTDDPEEEKKQKEFKSLLNKLTPEKYETIRNKLLAVGIEQAITLQGLIDQASICFFWRSILANFGMCTSSAH